jgi:tRNA (cytidine/uridine-2'-O-)-methyltransferase
MYCSIAVLPYFFRLFSSFFIFLYIKDCMFHIVLVHPEIPPNTGNAIRLSANTGCTLHLVKPLGFELTDYHLRRAGLDYHEYANLKVHEDWAAAKAVLDETTPQANWYALTTKGSRPHTEIAFKAGDVLVFGSETKGLPELVRDSFASTHRLRLPMLPTQRSLNLSNSIAVTVYEAWRQCGFAGAG